MSTSNVEKATTMLEGVASRDADFAATYLNTDSWVEHDPALGAGVDGLRKFMSQRPEESRHLEVLRAFEDGAVVVTQSQGRVVGRSVFFDVFRFEDDLIVEHWAFSTEGAPPNKSGHTQTDGPTQPRDDQDTERNKSFARNYYEAVHIAGEHDKIPQLVSKGCIRHEPGVLDGRDAFMSDVAVLTQNRSIDEIKILAGQGDFVFIAAQGTAQDDPCVYIDLYRVERDQIAERWGFSVQAAPRDNRRNATGLL